MINLKFKILNKRKCQTKRPVCRQAGMTYVELIVVLGIFATMSSIMLFNYNGFQSKIDIKNLSNDVALKIIQAQKYSINGELPPLPQQSVIASLPSGIDGWKPSYGVNFDLTNPARFIYFTDIDGDGLCDSTCTSFLSGGEYLETLNITKGNKISDISVFCPATDPAYTSLSIVFVRPSSGARFTTTPALKCANPTSAEIKVSSPSTTSPISSRIIVYPSGRIEIK